MKYRTSVVLRSLLGTAAVTAISMFGGCAALVSAPDTEASSDPNTELRFDDCASPAEKNAHLLGAHPDVVATEMIDHSNLANLPFYDEDSALIQYSAGNQGGLNPTYCEQHGHRFASPLGFDTFDWAGHTWGVREVNDVITWGGPQADDPEDGLQKWVKGASVNSSGDLVIQNEGIVGGVEIHVVESLGYGDYEFTYSADFDAQDPHTVLGIFTYDMAEMILWDDHINADGSTEIDFIEISRWGDVDREFAHGGVTYYPDDGKTVSPLKYVPDEFDVPKGHQTLTTKATWHPDYLSVITTMSDGTVLSDVTATTRIPRDDTQQLRINLWVTRSNSEPVADGEGGNLPAYQTAQPSTVVFHDFKHTPGGSPLS